MKAIRHFLLAALVFSSTSAAAFAAGEIDMKDRTALDVVAGSSSTTIAAKAIAAAGLTETCSHKEITLVVPTNDAFAALPGGMWDDLTRPENAAKLAKIVKYWMHDGTATSSALRTGPFDTEAGASMAVNADPREDAFWFDSGKVIQRDILVKNGVIHVVDKVPLPPAG